MKSKQLLYPNEKRLLRFHDKEFKNVSNSSIGISLIHLLTKYIFKVKENQLI